VWDPQNAKLGEIATQINTQHLQASDRAASDQAKLDGFVAEDAAVLHAGLVS
jgi:hypothetical protein